MPPPMMCMGLLILVRCCVTSAASSLACSRAVFLYTADISEGVCETMANGFSKRGALKDGWALARRSASATLPYYLIAAVILIALTLIEGEISPPDYVLLLLIVLQTLLFSAVSARFYLSAMGTKGERDFVRDPARLFLATLLMAFLFAIILFLIGLFLVLLSGIMLGLEGFDPEAAQGDAGGFDQTMIAIMGGPSGIVLALLIVVSSLAIGWLAARLTLFGVATIAAKQIRVFRTWSWTKGHGVDLVIAGLLAVIVPNVIVVIGYIGMEVVLSGRSFLDVYELDAWQTLTLEAFHFAIAWPVFLLGHGYAVAAFRQLNPEMLDVEAAFG